MAYKHSIELTLSNLEAIQSLYPQSLKIVEASLQEAKNYYYGKWHSDASFLKTAQAKKLIDKYIELS
ncbi:hypothetical protein F7734_52000 [Scytonema sp. UIC 10036]|uniref:hypothetical protein n=1 Tax=Scytonema sp. UIC 10036 TaxID=2304196 RepID=UPI0012DAB852|nr:hypothetical protein [Scytonema sp. UIC 10036]MUH00348.1 hypothetical protein [Scytonema sp. UIC 10036]